MKSLKDKQPPLLGRILEETKKAFLEHLNDIGLYEPLNRFASTSSPMVTYPISKLLVRNLSDISDPHDPYVNDRLDAMWDLFEILSRMNKSSESELRDLRARLLRIEHLLLKKVQA
jgi:hypothetical protein